MRVTRTSSLRLDIRFTSLHGQEHNQLEIGQVKFFVCSHIRQVNTLSLFDMALSFLSIINISNKKPNLRKDASTPVNITAIL